MNIKDFKIGKKVTMKGTVSLMSYTIWLELVRKYPTLKRPCHCRNDGIMEVAEAIRNRYIIVRLLDEENRFSIFDFNDLELLD